MTDKYELEKRIRQKGLTKTQVAKELGLSLNGFGLKLDNVNEFKASEMDKLMELLDLEDLSIFFKK